MVEDHHYEHGAMPVIFMVDDELMLLELAEMVLKPAGFQVRTFQDPSRAVMDYAAAAPPPELVITDFAMGGGLDGLDVIRECRKLHPDQKIILVSGTVDENIYANEKNQPDTFLAKPFKPDELVAAVRALIGD